MRGKGTTAGFTMMELLVSLFLVVIILAIAAVSLETVSDESRLRQPVSELTSFAKKAVKAAVAEQRSYSIFFYPRDFLMRERYPAVRLEEDFFKGGAIEEVEGEAEDEDETIVVFRHDLGEELGVEVRRWNREEWEVPNDLEWVFEPSGLCEPLSVRFVRRGGYVEVDFNPLTAGVEDERLYIP